MSLNLMKSFKKAVLVAALFSAGVANACHNFGAPPVFNAAAAQAYNGSEWIAWMLSLTVA